jgi:hypothetical protein
MSCKATGSSSHDFKFESLSGRSVSDLECTIDAATQDVKHFVIVAPVRKKFNKIRVTGRIVTDVTTANAKFVGGSILSNVEWQEIKSISTVDVTFDSASIRHVNAGSENVDTIVEEDGWNRGYERVDQNDLTITINLS